KKSIRNFIAVKKGKAADPKLLILSSHTDSVCNAGANDNGTGTIAALAIAKEIAQMELAHTVMFVGFDLEEKGLVGSKHFVSKLSQRDKKRLIGNINLEMMGTNSKQDGVFHVIDCDRADSNFITDRVAANIQKNGINLQINEACTTRSDHASFWSAGLPAVVASENFFGGDGDRCYHAPCDVVDERLDFTYMANIAKAMAYTVLDLAN
ncbi:MAG: M28 family peptidase, partial [Bacteriovoracaceae bacterium]